MSGDNKDPKIDETKLRAEMKKGAENLTSDDIEKLLREMEYFQVKPGFMVCQWRRSNHLPTWSGPQENHLQYKEPPGTG